MAILSLELLGAPRLLLDEQEIVIERRKTMALLAYVAVLGQRQTREGIATLLWPDYDRKASFAYLRQALWQLKKRLPDGIIESNRQGVALQNVHVDVNTFQEKLAACINDQPSADADCLPKLESAIKLYRGDFMAGFSLEDSAEFDRWQTQQTERLRHQRLQAHEYLVQGYSSQRAFESAIWQAKQWLAFDPLLEEAHRSLMRLFIATGRRHLAIQQYDYCRSLLADELGIEPELQTTALFKSIQSDQPVPELTLSAEAVAPPATVETPTNLPAPQSNFVGREATLATLAEQLQKPACQLLTLTGAGGYGKTSLALALGHQLLRQFPDGVFFVDLAPLDPTDVVADAIVKAADVRLQGSDPLRKQLLRWLKAKHVLLILDNYEHLLAQSDIIANILTDCPQCTLLVTSRERINLRQEWVVALDGLAYPKSERLNQPITTFAAIQLFVGRARRVQHHFVLDDDNRAAVITICRMVEGAPLAVELAASWVRMLTPNEIVEELEQNFDFLESNERNRVARHQSVRTLFDYSWRLLSTAEQHAFCRLAYFRSGFDRKAARAVATTSLRLLTTLSDKSLITRSADGRYRIPEILRQFGVEILANQPTTWQQVQTEHATYYSQLLEKSYHQLFGQAPAPALKQLEQENANIHQALRYILDKTDRLPSAEALHAWAEFHDMHCWFAEAHRFFTQKIGTVAQRPPSANQQQIHSIFLLYAGAFSGRLGQYEQAMTLLKQAIEQLLTNDNQPLHACIACKFLGFFSFNKRQMDIVAYAVDTALATAGNDTRSIIYAYDLKTMQHLAKGELDEALATSQHTIHLTQQIGFARRYAQTLTNLGLIHAWRREFDQGKAILEQAWAATQVSGDRNNESYVVSNIARLALEQGNYEEALGHFRKLLKEYERNAHYFPILSAKINIAHALTRLSHASEAKPLLIELKKEYHQLGEQVPLNECVGLLAVVHQQLGDLDAAIGCATYAVQHPRTEPLLREAIQKTLAELKATVSAERFAQAANLSQNKSVADLPRIS